MEGVVAALGELCRGLPEPDEWPTDVEAGRPGGAAVLVAGAGSCGKAAAVRRAAEECGLPVFEMTSEGLYDLRLKGCERPVQLPLEAAAAERFVCLFRHVDLLCAAPAAFGGGGDSACDPELNAAVSDFLTRQLPRGALLVATARTPEGVADAVLSCFQRVIRVPPPTFAARVAAANRALRARAGREPTEQERADVEWLCGRIGGFTLGDVEAAVGDVWEACSGDREGRWLRDVWSVQVAPFSSVIAASDATFVADVPAVGWEQVHGHAAAKRRLVDALTLRQRHPVACGRVGLRESKGALLYGCPGTGKTLLAKAVATEVGGCFLLASIPALLRPHVGESEAVLRDLFAAAARQSPAVVFLDECQAVFASRSGSTDEEGGHDARVVTQLLVEVDRAPAGVFVLAATNVPWDIDPALLAPGRLDVHLHISAPTEEERAEYLVRRCGVAEEEAAQCAANCTGYTYADLAAVHEIARETGGAGASLEDAVAMTHGSATAAMVQRLEEWERAH